MIALIGNRPVLQVGRYQVSCYDSQWLRAALERAMTRAEREDFPFVEEICQGIFHYLENKCSLRLLPLTALYEKMRRMLEQIGCENIARELMPLAPPVTLSLLRLVEEQDGCFELSLFSLLRREIDDLSAAGALEIHVVQARETVLRIRQAQKWDRGCERLMGEIEIFLQSYKPQVADAVSMTMVMHGQVQGA
ncbi:MAG: hypothetical protein RLZZ224_1397 [Verrucomicrobiota bacterium]